MKLSAPIYRLKRQARVLSRQEGIPHHEALDRIARDQGFSSWSLLASQASELRPSNRLRSALENGDLVLVGARPGHGKTLLSLKIAVEAMKAGKRSIFFSLECTEADVIKYFAAIGENLDSYTDQFEFDDSDDICATYMASRLQLAAPGTVVVVDYLQLLDQKRTNPELTQQIRQLKAFARDSGVVIVFISQIHRDYNPQRRPTPALDDVRLPNPLDLTLFDKTCFVHDGEVEFASIS
jgi:replicative DNA helicase